MEATFEADSWSGSSRAAQASLDRGHLVLANDDVPDGLHLELEGHDVVVRIWEASRLRAGNSSFQMVPSDPTMVDERSYLEATVGLNAVNEKWFVGAFQFQRATVFGPENIQILPTVSFVELAGGTPFRVQSGSGFEPFAYRHRGITQPVAMDDFSARILNPTTTIIMNATLEVQSDSGSETIDPYGDYSKMDLQGVQTLRWVTVHVASATLTVAVDAADESTMERTWFVENSQFESSPDYWIDNSSGELRVNSTWFRLEGSRLIAQGNLSFSLAPSKDAAAGTYQVRLDGDVTDLRTSKGVLVDSAATSLVLVGALGVGLVILMVLREVVIRGMGLALVPLYTKLRKPELLDHERRQSLYEAIKADPGVTFLQLHQKLKEQFGRAGGFGFGALTYHLSQLERFDLIVSKREGRFRRYFENGGRFGRDTKRIAVLQTPPVPRVVEILLAEPGASQTRIHEHVAKTYPVTRQAVGYHLKRLQKKELLTVERAGKANAYFPTEKLERLAEFAEAKTASLRELRAERTASG